MENTWKKLLTIFRKKPSCNPISKIKNLNYSELFEYGLTECTYWRKSYKHELSKVFSTLYKRLGSHLQSSVGNFFLATFPITFSTNQISFSRYLWFSRKVNKLILFLTQIKLFNYDYANQRLSFAKKLLLVEQFVFPEKLGSFPIPEIKFNCISWKGFH